MSKLRLVIIAFVIGVIATLLFLYGWNWLPENSTIDFTTLILTLGIFIALGGVLWSTNKQISNQNKNVKKQIENQNKESHRPYLCLSRCSNIDESRLSEIVNFKVLVDLYNGVDNYKRHYIKLFNAGYGTASNIKFLGTNYHSYKRKIDISYLDDTAKNHLINFINNDDEIYVGLGTNIHSENKNILLPIYILVFYTDFNQNVYSALVNLETPDQSIFTANFYNDNLKTFESKIKEMKIDYNNIKKQYIEITFSNSKEEGND